MFFLKATKKLSEVVNDVPAKHAIREIYNNYQLDRNLQYFDTFVYQDNDVIRKVLALMNLSVALNRQEDSIFKRL
jgi:hypothetical protein